MWRSVGVAASVALLSLAVARLLVRPNEGVRGIDHGLFYYATLMVVSGENPYQPERVLERWEADGAPPGLDPRQYSGFVNPPSAVLLFLPLALVSPANGHLAVWLLNVAYLLGCSAILFVLPGKTWSLEARLLLAAFPFLMVPVSHALERGQSSVPVVFMILLALLLLRHGKLALSGIVLALALAKFTISLPLIVAIGAVRSRTVLLIAVTVFVALNLAIALYCGSPSILLAYRQTVAEQSGPNTSYDEMSTDPRYDQTNLVNVRRASYLLIGPHRALVDAATMLFILSVSALLGYAFIAKTQQSSETRALYFMTVALICGLAFFYHRDHDLAVLPAILYGLVEYGRRSGWRPGALLVAIILLTLALGPLPGKTLRLLPSANGWVPAAPYASLAVALLLVLTACLPIFEMRNLQRPARQST